MEGLAPGFSDELVAAGALVRDLSREFRVHAAGDLISPGRTPIPVYLASRPLIERVLRARVAAHDRITLRSACQVAGPVVPDRARRARGAAAMPVEGGRWLVTLVGMHGQHPPDALDELRVFADSLPVPMVRELLDQHEVVSPKVARYRYPTPTRRRYDKLKEHPRG